MLQTSIFANASFIYDGDSKRVKSEITSNIATTTTCFVGSYYEVSTIGTGQAITKYYYSGSQRIAMRKDGILYYILGDHLGSTSLITHANGTILSETRCKAWGEVRYSSAYTPTNYSYTGQYSYTDDFGLIFYNARWYDPYLNQFIYVSPIDIYLPTVCPFIQPSRVAISSRNSPEILSYKPVALPRE